MSMNLIILFLSIIILCCLILDKITEKSTFPPLLAFILLGMLIGVDGIFKYDFDDFNLTNDICSIALALIMFYGGFCTNILKAKKVLVPATIMSTLGVIITSFLLAFILIVFVKVDYKTAILISSVIGSTDATTVFNILRKNKLNLKYNTAELLEIESGSNDPMAYSLTIIGITLVNSINTNIISITIFQFLIGAIVGFLMSQLLTIFLNKIQFKNDTANIISIFAILLFSYSISIEFYGNGYLAVYILGIFLGKANFKDKNYILKFFSSLTNISQMIIFFLLGLTVTPSRFKDVYIIAIIIFLLLTFIVRPLMNFLLLLPFKAKFNQIIFTSFAGLRGASSIVFAIFCIVESEKHNFDATYIFDIVFVIVLLSILLQGTFLPLIAKKINLIDNSVDVMKTFNDYQNDSDICFMKMKVKKDNVLIGKKLLDIHFTSIRIAMIIRNEIPIIPKGDTTILLNDLLVFSGTKFINSENLNFKEIYIHNDSKFTNKVLSEIEFEDNETIVMIKRNDETIVPYGDFVFQNGDIIIIPNLH